MQSLNFAARAGGRLMTTSDGSYDDDGVVVLLHDARSRQRARKAKRTRGARRLHQIDYLLKVSHVN